MPPGFRAAKRAPSTSVPAERPSSVAWACSIVARAVSQRRLAVWPRRLGLVAHFEGVDWPEDYGRLLVGQREYVGVAPLDDTGLVTVGLVRDMPKMRLGSASVGFKASLAS